MAAQRKWQVKVQHKQSTPQSNEQLEKSVVTKEQFLRVLAQLQDNAGKGFQESVSTLTLTTSPVVSTMPPPPPGLSLNPPPLPEPPAGLNSPAGRPTESPAQADESFPAQSPAGYQVLLRGFSEWSSAERREHIIRAMLEQASAHLDADAIRFDFRPGGKVLIEFRTFASVQQCISHFHGHPWGDGGARINALYVRTVKKPAAANNRDEDMTVKATAKRTLSANALAFIPSAALSAKACAFIPQKLGTIHEHKPCSDASTDDTSENCDSESIDGGPADSGPLGFPQEGGDAVR
jgi:hypothetical protein